MHRKLTDKEKKIVVAALILLVAAFLVYTAIRYFRSKNEENATGNAETVSLVELDTKEPSVEATEEESGTEEEEPSSEETEPETEEAILPWEETLPPQTDPPGFWEDLTATETDPPIIINPTPAPTTAPTVAPTTAPATTAQGDTVTLNGITVSKSGTYSDKDHVALYIHAFGCLPSNYITKDQSDRISNWRSQGYYIGGDRFGNREGLLPKKSGRQYYECDISYTSSSNRGARRIVYSNDGLIYYTDDHYESFTRLY